MFTQSADIYDLVYSFKDYEKESADIAQAIKTARPGCKSILDVGCGTSEHHKYLGRHFSIDGLDLDENFIRISQQKNPGGQYTVGNMTRFNLNKQYDAVICLFSSIGYLQSVDEIVSAFRCFHQHLKPNGLVMLELWFDKSNWQEGKVHMVSVDKEDIKICRMNKAFTRGDFTIIIFNYLVGTPDEGVRNFVEEHKLRLTSREEMTEAFRQAGFEVSFEEKGLTGRGMYYGSKSEKV